MAFERFVGRGRVSSAKVTIFANDLIEFNTAATRKFALNRFNYAVLFYNEEARQVGIQFTNNASEMGAIRMIKKPSGIAIMARDFVHEHGLQDSRGFAYDIQYSGEHDMYIIQLTESTRKGKLRRV